MMVSSSVVLSVHDLSVHAYGVPLLSHINLHVNSGDVLAILGPNGAGKTSLINAIANPEWMTELRSNSHRVAISGSVEFTGSPLLQKQSGERARQVALLPQLSALNFPFTVSEVVELGRLPHSTGIDIDRYIIEEALVLLDILHLKHRLYTQLSGGEKQRVQLARVMTQLWRKDDALQRLLILDEPTSSLDLGHQQQLMRVIRQFADQGVAIIMVAHDVNLVSQHADQLLALCCGEVVAQGKPENIITQSLMQQLYQVNTTILAHPHTQKPVVVFEGSAVD